MMVEKEHRTTNQNNTIPMADLLVNRVANSPIITLDLAQYLPTHAFDTFDIKDYLYMELILKEKEFRTVLKQTDWSHFKGKIVLVLCSTDAIIPQWAYALIATTLSQYAHDIFVGTKAEYLKAHFKQAIAEVDVTPYQGKPMILKGCGDTNVPAEAFSSMAIRLQDVAKSIMYGEACSAVPIYKKPKV